MRDTTVTLEVPGMEPVTTTLGELERAANVTPRRTWEELSQAFVNVRIGESQLFWGRADMCLEARREHGAKFGTIGEAAGISRSYAGQLVYLARNVPDEHRHVQLTAGHWALLARCEAPTDWCCRAVDNEWSIADLREALGFGAVDPDEARDRAQLENRVQRYVERQRPPEVVLRGVTPDGEPWGRQWPA